MSSAPILTPAETIAKLADTLRKVREEHRAELAPLKAFNAAMRSRLGLAVNADLDMLATAVDTLLNGPTDDPKAVALRDSAVAAKVKAQTEELGKRTEAAEARAASLEAEATAEKIDRALDRAASAAGLLMASVPDMKLRAAGLFVVDEKGVARTKAGVPDVPPNLTTREWAESILRQTCPHYFPGSEGGGAGRGSRDRKVADPYGAFGGRANPWSPENRGNATRRALALQALGAEKCRELAAMAGTSLAPWER